MQKRNISLRFEVIRTDAANFVCAGFLVLQDSIFSILAFSNYLLIGLLRYWGE